MFKCLPTFQYKKKDYVKEASYDFASKINNKSFKIFKNSMSIFNL